MSNDTVLREQLKMGDCFEYIDHPEQNYLAGKKIIVANSERDKPEDWGWSGDLILLQRGKWRVRRIPHWNDTSQQPAILSCVAPMDDFDRVSLETAGANKLTGLECLALYEVAIQAEGSNGVLGALNGAQVALARRMWSAKLRRKVVEANKREHERVVCDDTDELPNMAYVIPK